MYCPGSAWEVRAEDTASPAGVVVSPTDPSRASKAHFPSEDVGISSGSTAARYYIADGLNGPACNLCPPMHWASPSWDAIDAPSPPAFGDARTILQLG